MPKDDERKEMTQEEIDAREEKFRTFFTTSVAQVPEEMTRRDDENEEKPKSLLGRLLRREKGEQQESGTPEESRTGEIQLGGEEPEEPSDLELVLTLEEEVTEPKPEQPKPAEPVSAPQPEPEKPQKPAEPIKAPEPPAPKPEKKPAEKQAAPRKKAVQYEPRTPQEQYEDREMQALKAMLFGAKLPPQEEEPSQPVKPAKPEKSTPEVPVIATKPDAEKEPDAAPEKPAVPMPAMVFAEDKASKPHAAPAMQFFGKGDDEKAPAAPARATPPDNDDSMSLPLMFLNDGDEVAPVEPPKEEAPAQPAEEAGTAPAAPEAAPVEEAPVEEEKTPEMPEQVGERLHQMGAALTLRCALGGILALVLLHFGLAAEGLVGPLGGLDPVTAPAAFYAANLLFLALALAVGWPVVRDGLKGLRGERPSMETMPAMAACAALLQAAVALLNAQNYQASSFTLLSGIAALGLFLALLGDRVLLASVQGGFKLAQAGPEHRGAFRAKDKDLIRILSKDMNEKDPWVLLSRPAEWDDAMVEQGFGPRACERRARKTNYILLGAAVLAGLVFCVFGGGLNGGAAALTAVLCMGSPLSSTLIAGFASLRLQQTAAASGAVIPGWAAIEELGGVDTVQADADELFTQVVQSHVGALLDDDHLHAGGVAVGEVHDQLPILGDGDTGHNDVGLVLLHSQQSGVEVHIVHDQLQTQLPGDGAGNLYVNTLEAAVVGNHLIGREGGVGGHDQLAGLDGLQLGSGGRGGCGLSGRGLGGGGRCLGGGGGGLGGVAAAAAGEHGHDHQNGQRKCEYLFHSFYSPFHFWPPEGGREFMPAL